MASAGRMMWKFATCRDNPYKIILHCLWVFVVRCGHRNQGANMNKLIETFRKCPTPSNRAKLQTYLQKHMMALCLATPEEIAFLKAHEFKI